MPTKFAAAALALAILSFVHLFGVEKAALAVALGAMVLKDPALNARGQKLAKAAVIIGLGYLLVVSGIFLYHMPALNSLAEKLGK
jgi:hypothetical protein